LIFKRFKHTKYNTKKHAQFIQNKHIIKLFKIVSVAYIPTTAKLMGGFYAPFIKKPLSEEGLMIKNGYQIKVIVILSF